MIEGGVAGEKVLVGPLVRLRPFTTLIRRRPSRRELAALALATAISALVIATFGAAKSWRILRGASWGAVLLASMVGWGSLVERLASPQRVADIGLRLVWGMAGLIAAGGALCLVSLATRPVLCALVLGGSTLWIIDAFRRSRVDDAVPKRRWTGWPPGVIVALTAVMALAATYYFAGASGSTLNINDDHAAYLVFPPKILATGTFLEPFSLRRVTALGGHSFLQTLVFAGAASPLQVSMLDLGISLFAVIALILGAPDERAPRATKMLWVLPVLVMVALPNLRANSASEVSGVAVFVGLYRTAAWRGFGLRPRARATVLGLLAAAACTLRQSYFVPAAIFMIAYYLPVGIAGLRTFGPERRQKLAAVGIAAAAMILFLVPWAVLSYRSHRTFLFPLMTGNYHPEYGGLTTASNLEDRLKFFWLNICYCSPIRSIPFFLFAGALIPSRKTGRALPALLIATVVGFIAVVYSLPLSDEKNIARYYFGFTVAAVVAVILASIAALPRRRDLPLRAHHLIPLVFAAAAIVAHVQEMRDLLYKDYLHLEAVISNARAKPSSLLPKDESYRALQNNVPQGARMLVMVDEPLWFDFHRNPIDIVDLPGAVSPAPGMPLDDNEKLATYLHNRGYRYVAFVRPAASKSLYRRTHWTKMLTASEEIWRKSAPFYLNMFDRWDGLASSRAHLFDNGQLVALDLDVPQKH
jgi:hypothetical protein